MSGFGLANVPDDAKFQELVLYICSRSDGDVRFGATKLNKLLFYADFLAYRLLGQAITWQPYQRLKNGPAPRRLVPILEEMETRGDIAIRQQTYYEFTQKRAYALRDADLTRFSGKEVALIDQLIADCWGKSAKAMSIMSHSFRGWSLADDGENIPYEVALVNFQKPSKAQISQGTAMADELLVRARELMEDDE